MGARMTQIRWGILGASKFAREHMGPAIHAAKGAVLSAVASRTPQSVAPFKDFAAGCRAVMGYDALIADPDIDAIYINLANHQHHQWAQRSESN